ncbi:ester cyclase [Chitinophaga solisilvae]|uniref:ester cyclase n=1 Tax=Chitinophaga solisilvae TaxID=1233460 RepID=UPI00136C0950|nr:ester cyclase [Chitinophaga solisilvae]
MKPIQTILVLTLSMTASHHATAQTRTSSQPKNEMNMHMTTARQHKQIIAALYEKVLNGKDFSLLPAFISPDYTGENGSQGPAAFGEPLQALIKALPDIHYHITEMIAEDDKVLVRWKLQGTHLGPFRQYPPSGRTITNEGMATYQLKDGKITARHLQTDRLGFLQSLEVLPAGFPQLPAKQTSTHGIHFIDKFLVPVAAKEAFLERVRINREMIRRLPGFIEDAAYAGTDADNNLIFLTIARWENKEALAAAKAAVQATYQQEGFDMNAMMIKWGVKMERETYERI